MEQPADIAEQPPTLAELAVLVEQQRREIAELRAQIGARRSPPDDRERRPATSRSAQPTSRRTLLRRAGFAGAAGAIVGAGTVAGRAAALPLDVPGTTDVGGPTRLNATGGLFSSENVFTAADGTTAGSSFPAASAAYAFGDRVSNGFYAFVAGRDDGNTSTGHGLVARRTSAGRSNILMPSSGGPPTGDTYAHRAGELRSDSVGGLWWCSASGTPGTWKRLAGGTTKTNDELAIELATLTTESAPTLELLTPFRAYDSRLDMSPIDDGPLAVGSSRVIPIRDSRDVVTGTVADADVVPAGAFGLVYTVSIITPTGTGFLTIVPSTDTEITAATINWDSTSPTVLNNSSTVRMAGDREVRVIVGGVAGGQTHFVIDVLGYYETIFNTLG